MRRLRSVATPILVLGLLRRKRRVTLLTDTCGYWNSQEADMVLARQGRTPDQARALLARDIMTPGCATCDAGILLSEAVSLMTGRRMAACDEFQHVGVVRRGGFGGLGGLGRAAAPR